MDYQYKMHVFKDGKLVFEQEKIISRDTLICNTGRSDREAFLSLVNRWNKQGLYNVGEHGRIYVYVAL